MLNPMSRRHFIRLATLSTAGCMGALTTHWSFGQDGEPAAAERPLYCFPMLGDLHFDRMEHHDMEWVMREQPGDLRQIEGYVQVTEKHTPRLLSEIARATERAGTAVPFVIQVGDLVEGLCGSYALQELQFRDAFAAIEKASLGAPLLLTKGNHDITGPGAPEAFDKVLLPWLSQQAGKQLTNGHYWVRHDEDLFVFFDAYRPDLPWLERTLAEQTARHLFFIIHPPVVPYNARANWIVFANEDQADQRRQLLALLGRHGAIVLSGHLHKYSLLSRKTDVGSFVQLAVNSVVRNEVEKPRGELEGLDSFNPDLTELEPRFSHNTVDRRRQMLTDEAPSIEKFEYADVPGYAMVRVFGDRVDIDLYTGVSDAVWKARPLATAPAPAM